MIVQDNNIHITGHNTATRQSILWN